MKFVKKPYFFRFVILLLLQFFFNGYSFDLQTKTLDYSAGPGDNYKDAQYRLWYPQNMEHLEAIVVLVPGSNWDGRDAVHDSVWQQFAVENHTALVACYLTDKPHEQGFIEEYVNVSQGSGQTLLDALHDFAERSNHKELASAPLLLWGMSAGGQFNYEFTAWKPERVAAFVVNKGGIYYSALLNHKARNVPGLLFTGENDMAFRSKTIEGLFAVNRRSGALWTLVQEPGIGHETGRSRELALVFFKEVLKQRLSTTELHETGYLGDLENHTFSKIETDTPAPKVPTAWLISEPVAQLWQKIISGEK